MINPYIIARISPYDIESLNGLQMPKTYSLMELLHGQQVLYAQCLDTINGRLFELIGESSGLQRKALLKIKRKLSSLNSIQTNGLQFLQRDMPDIADQLEYLLQLDSTIAFIQMELNDTFAAELRSIRTNLQLLTKNVEFINGLFMSSQELSTKIHKYHVTPIEQQNKKLRKIERSLVLYLTRMVAKTSPFSSFTLVGNARLTEHGELIIKSVSWTARRTVNHILSLLVWERITHTSVNKYIPIQVNPYVHFQTDENRIRIIKTQGMPKYSKYLDQNEQILTLEGNSTVASLYKLMQDNPNTTLHEFAVKTGSEDVIRTIEHLINMGILRFKTPFNDDDLDYSFPLLRFIESLPDPGNEEIAHVVSLLKLCHKFLGREAGLEEGRECLQRIKHELEFLKLDVNPIIYEDCFLQDSLSVPKKLVESLTTDGKTIEEISCLFDTQLPLKLHILRVFKKEFGEGGICRDLSLFKDALDRNSTWFINVKNSSFDPKSGQFNDDQLFKEWSFLRNKFLKLVFGGFSKGLDVELNAEDLREIGEEIPLTIKSLRPNSFCYFVQPDCNNNLVINKMSDGYGKFLGRFINGMPESEHVTRSVGSLVRESIKPQVLLTELNSTFGFNANTHRLIGDTYVYYPGQLNDYSLECPRLDELRIEHDVDLDKLIVRWGERELKLLYAQFLMPRLTPPLFRLLISLSDLSNFEFGLPYLYYVQLSKDEKDRSIIYMPRVSIGKLIISRRQWWINKAAFMKAVGIADPEVSQAQVMYNIWKWLNENGIPEQFYMRANLLMQQQAQVSAEDYQDGMRKPLYVDSKSYLTIRTFINQLNIIHDSFIVEEALPSQKDIPFSNRGRHMLELVVETYRGDVNVD